MKKRAVCFVLTMVLLVSVFALNISATGVEWITLDFENDTVGAMPESFPRDLPDDANASPEAVRCVENMDGNKVFKVDTMETSTVINSVQTSATDLSEALIQFDILVEDVTSKGYLCLDFLVGNKAYTRANFFIKGNNVIEPGNGFNGGWSRPSPHTKGQWHRYLLYWTGIGTSSSSFAVYSKPLNDADAEFEYVSSSKPHSAAGWAKNTVRCRIYSIGMEFCIDNIAIWKGDVDKGGYFELNGEKIEAISEASAGTLTATTEVISGSMEARQVCPVMVVLDSKSRMLDCEFVQDAVLEMGPNKLTASVDTTEYADLLEGGYAGFYIWQDLLTAHPLFAPVELN